MAEIPQGFELERPGAPSIPEGFELEERPRLRNPDAGPGFAAEALGDVLGPIGDLGRRVAELTRDQLKVAETHYRVLGSGIGLPIDPPSEDEIEEYNQAAMEMAGTVAGAKVFGLGAKAFKALARAAGRGGSLASTRRFLADNASHMVPSGAKPTASLTRELARPTGAFVATEAITDAADLTSSEFWDELLALGSAIGAANVAGRDARANLLLQHPRFRAWAMRASRAGLPSQMIGGMVGLYLARAAGEALDTGERAMERLRRLPGAIQASAEGMR